MKNKKIFAIVLIMITILVSSGCNEKKQEHKAHTEEKTKMEYCSTVKVKEQEEVMYDVYNERLGSYDIASNKYQYFYETDGVFAYKTAGSFEMYAVGSSNYNYFSILKRNKKGIEKVMDIVRKGFPTDKSLGS